MKKLLVALVLLCTGTGFAVDPLSVNRSSHVYAANSSTYIACGYLDKVIVGIASSGGVLEIYSATATAHMTAATLVSSMSLATAGISYHFENLGVRGIMWRTSSNTNGVTIIYKK